MGHGPAVGGLRPIYLPTYLEEMGPLDGCWSVSGPWIDPFARPFLWSDRYLPRLGKTGIFMLGLQPNRWIFPV